MGLGLNHFQHFQFSYKSHRYDFEWSSGIEAGGVFYVSMVRSGYTCENEEILAACRIWASSAALRELTAADFLQQVLGVTEVMWIKGPK